MVSRDSRSQTGAGPMGGSAQGGGMVPVGTPPGGAVPEGTIPEESASGEAVPGEAVLAGAASGTGRPVSVVAMAGGAVAVKAARAACSAASMASSCLATAGTEEPMALAPDGAARVAGREGAMMGTSSIDAGAPSSAWNRF